MKNNILTKERTYKPWILNLYGFVNNNPINYIDPWGEDTWIGVGLQAGGSALALGASINGALIINTETGEMAAIGTFSSRSGNYFEGGGGGIAIIFPNGPKCAKEFEKGKNAYFEAQASWGVKLFGGGITFGRYSGMYLGVGIDIVSIIIRKTKFLNFKKFVWVGTGVSKSKIVNSINTPEECKCKK